MGQLISKKGLESRHCTPVGLYDSCSWDHKSLKKLIVEKKLAPIFTGNADFQDDSTEECPICMLYYPFLNVSNCCKKNICTECFLQIRKPPNLAPSNDEICCPFCMTSNYNITFLGRRSEEQLKREREEETRISRLERQATARRPSEFPTQDQKPKEEGHQQGQQNEEKSQNEEDHPHPPPPHPPPPIQEIQPQEHEPVPDAGFMEIGDPDPEPQDVDGGGEADGGEGGPAAAAEGAVPNPPNPHGIHIPPNLNQQEIEDLLVAEAIRLSLLPQS
mmetsp:Transcript_38666/g.53887  ORF Transcript_38666/g.53887 Transcript_38666/m.53887 type:complete len:275 (-) Transcript_38666:66-890(-)|eukprot:CAMPEP_0201492084 /NCGR_PEP_ID=MMETSP0151_2-20130828/32068_1 /ASSEMBLY_ACC=CAM_ASM_000257 /TAXON_ID=200890 /ORGANISM="Paramoeba atlantica, Strain 621/1 / CCAP 1560/9" /LENGTH=274 /DNA_ID=CAMNT_0047878743 /DNA_START=155 /DNA_END=979 /DNA_ORIENTATION=+